MEIYEARDFMGYMYVKSEFVFFKRSHIAHAYFFHVEPLELIDECHIIVFVGSVAVYVNGMEAQYSRSSDHSCS